MTLQGRLAQEKQTERERLLRKIIAAIRSSLDIDELLTNISIEVGDLFKADRISILKTPEDMDIFCDESVKCEYKRKKNIKGVSDLYFPQETRMWIREQIKNYPLIYSDIQESNIPDAIKQAYANIGLKSILVMPVKKDDDIWGIISLTAYDYYRDWSEDEVAFLESISDQIYIAIKQAELFSTTKKQAEREALLRTITDTIRSSLDINEVKSRLTYEIGKAFNADRCAIMLFSPVADRFLPIDEYSQYLASPDELSVIGHLDDKAAFEPIASLLKQNKVQIVYDVDELYHTNTEYIQLLKRNEIKSDYGFPIFYNNELIGAFAIHYTKNKIRLENKDIELLKIVADQISIAIKQAELFSTTKKQAEREMLLRKITEAIRSSLDIRETFSIICYELARLFEADRAVIVEFPNDQNYLEFIVRREYLRSDRVKEFSNSFDPRGNAYWAEVSLKKGVTQAIDNIEESDTPDFFKNNYLKYGLHSVVNAPIQKGDHKWGGIGLSLDKVRHWTKDDIELLETIADQIYIAIKHAELYSNQKKQAEREALLARVTRVVRSSLDINEVLNTICSEIINIFEATRVLILDYTNEVSENIILIEYKKLETLLSIKNSNQDEFVKIHKFVKNFLDGNNSNFIINNIDEADIPESSRNYLKKLGLKSMILVPLKTENYAWGSLVISEHSYCRRWTEDEINLLATLAENISIVIKQANMHSTIKSQLEHEKLLRSDDSILVNQNLANNIGLKCTISYSFLVNNYNYANDEGKLIDGYALIYIDKLKNQTYLDDIEQIEAIEKLVDLGLISLKKEETSRICYKIVQEQTIAEQYMRKCQPERSFKLQTQLTNKLYNSIHELTETYSRNFSTDATNAVRYFLTCSNQLKKVETHGISKLYFATLCRTLYDFMKQYSLDLKRLESIINEWFGKEENIDKEMISFGLTNKVLISRLKKILLYRLQESRMLAPDFYSKMDFYSSMEFELLSSLNDE